MKYSLCLALPVLGTLLCTDAKGNFNARRISSARVRLYFVYACLFGFAQTKIGSPVGVSLRPLPTRKLDTVFVRKNVD